MVSFIGAIMRHDPAPLPESVPEVLRQVVMKALQREPSQRYQSAIEMRQELREAERMLWLQEREAREAPPTLTPTLVNEPPATLVLPELQETIMPHTPATEVEREKENAARIVAPTIAAPPPQPGPNRSRWRQSRLRLPNLSLQKKRKLKRRPRRQEESSGLWSRRWLS